jgi:hypothetical protein
MYNDKTIYPPEPCNASYSVKNSPEPQCQKSSGDIATQMMHLTETTAKLEKYLSMLCEKLAPIFGPDHVLCEKPCDTKPEAIISPLAKDLKNLNEVLKSFNSKINVAIDRIQL